MSKKIKTFDIVLAILPIIFVATSVAVLYSLFLGTPNVSVAFKQGIYSLIGLAVMFAASFLDYRLLRGTSWVFYLIGVGLLVLVEFFGKVVNGAKNWLDLGFFPMQPSELAKIFIILYLAAYFSKRIGKITWSHILISLIILFLPLFLILREPDLGTALVIVFIYLVLLFSSRPSKMQTIIIGGSIALAVMVMVLSVFRVPPLAHVLKDYQRDRILVFLYPEKDPRKSGYHVIQAQIAVGSGGIVGRGLGHGSQSQLQFLPEPDTDFIFSGIAESFGFLGSAVFLLLYAYLIIKIISISGSAQDNFGMLVALGAAAMLSFQTIINVGMNIGLAPVTGIPLPLLSHGGTSMITVLFMLGLIQSIFMRHKKLSF